MATTTTLPLPLHNRVAIVTGASGGIGTIIAIHLASLGANLVINYNSSSGQANWLVTELNTRFPSTVDTPRAVSIKADVSDPTQVKAMFDTAEAAFNSPPHIVVNAAGVLDSSYAPISNSSVDEFDRTFAVNTRGAYLVCKEAANRVKRGGGGRIVCLTSSSSMVAGPGFGAYAASKAAVEAMVKILAKELKGTGITANCVAPGPISTRMFFQGKSVEMVIEAMDECPLERLGGVWDVAPLVGFLVGDDAEWVNGQVVRVNGGTD